MHLIETSFGLKGRLQVSVVEKGRVIRQYPEVSNLILNVGLDALATYTPADQFLYAVCGTGVTPTESLSTPETATVVSGIATISSVGFLNGISDVGNTIKLAGGQVYTITGNISTTQCNVLPAVDLGPDTFTIYFTNQSALTTESTGPGATTRRTNTYLSSAPNCLTVTTGNTTLLTRTYDFTAEVAPATYNEVGFSRVSTVGGALFSRIKLASGVPVGVGQQLRVKYSVAVSISPSSATAFGVSPVIGWASATGVIGFAAIPLACVDTNGSTFNGPNSVDGFYYAQAGGIAAGGSIFTTTDNMSHSYGSSFDPHGGGETSVSSVLSSYVSGSYTRDKYGTFAVGQSNSTNLYQYGIEFFNGMYSHYRTTAYVIFNSPQTKLSTHTLTLGFRYTWGRII